MNTNNVNVSALVTGILANVVFQFFSSCKLIHVDNVSFVLMTEVHQVQGSDKLGQQRVVPEVPTH